MTAAAARKPKHAHALPRVIGHRGAAGLAPENTPAAFRKAAALGVTWVEFDVHLSADGVPVIIHDDTVERTTDGKGKVAALSLVELKRLDAGASFGAGFRGERIPTLAEMLDLLRELGLGAVVEIKPSPGAEIATAEATVRLLQERWPETLPPPMVSSFERLSIERAHAAAPGIARAFLVHDLPRNWQEEVDRLGCSAVHASQRGLRAEQVAAVTRAGLPLFAYTVNDAARAAELFSWGVAAVFSDRPDLVLPVAGI
ncbi:MAG TPA: glycerophosphodiester phosphodiesterase [Stellaceae bacterium]|nr:glycerophosphodiester phosphodiesterase [Stellaceae bacterium]